MRPAAVVGDTCGADAEESASPTARFPAVVLFDLDGTLSDSAPGILGALRLAFAANGIAPLDPTTERSLLGPPFYTSLPPHIGGTEKLADVIAAYRAHYVDGGGLFDTTAYPGAVALVHALAARGTRLAVATSKPERHAVTIVDHLGMTGCFETVGGDTLDGALATKALVIGEVLARLGRPDPNTVLMIGDREHDVHGARAHGIDALGAGWGYGTAEELVAAGALAVCASPDDLGRRLGVAS